VKDGCKEEDLVGLIFNTIGISDAITMATDGKPTKLLNSGNTSSDIFPGMRYS